MRIETQASPEFITAAIFNRLEGPGANPVALTTSWKPTKLHLKC